MRLDKGTKTGTMATMHAYIHQFNAADTNPHDTVIYGPSTSNQVLCAIVIGDTCMVILQTFILHKNIYIFSHRVIYLLCG